MKTKIHTLRTCNQSLFQKPELLKKLPTYELTTYLKKCFSRGKAMMYPHTSMYSVCILHALRFFKREQFLFLRYEDLMKMHSDALIRLISRFTGLYVDESLLKVAQSSGKCQAVSQKAKKPMSFSSNSVDAAEILRDSSTHLEALFDPYNHVLTELIHPAFHWHTSDHRKRPLNATEREAHIKAAQEAEERKVRNKKKSAAQQAALATKSKAWVAGNIQPRAKFQLDLPTNSTLARKSREVEKEERESCRKRLQSYWTAIELCLKLDNKMKQCNFSRTHHAPCQSRLIGGKLRCRAVPPTFTMACTRNPLVSVTKTELGFPSFASSDTVRTMPFPGRLSSVNHHRLNPLRDLHERGRRPDLRGRPI